MRADALRPITRDAVVLLDPARRSGGRRRFDPRAYTPPLDEVFDAYRGRAAAVKCAPGIDFRRGPPAGFRRRDRGDLGRGSVREACLWSAGLAEPGVRRRASVLDRDEVLTDTDPDDCPVRPPGRWIVDPDGAVVRAGLVRQYAARHGLWQLDPTSPTSAGTDCPPGCAASRCSTGCRCARRPCGRRWRRGDCGALEILVRGVDVDPDALRRRLRPAGHTALSVVITRLGAGSAARRWRLFAGRRPEAAGTLSAMRTLNLAALLVTTAVLGSPGLPVAGAATGCAAMGGVVEGEGICHVTANDPLTRWICASR